MKLKWDWGMNHVFAIGSSGSRRSLRGRRRSGSGSVLVKYIGHYRKSITVRASSAYTARLWLLFDFLFWQVKEKIIFFTFQITDTLWFTMMNFTCIIYVHQCMYYIHIFLSLHHSVYWWESQKAHLVWVSDY